MAWSFVVCDRNGNPIGELREASDRVVRLPLNRTPTFTFTLEVDNPRAANIVDTGRTLIKAYEDTTGVKVLRKIGPVALADKTRNSDGGTIGVTSAGPGWRLGHRLIGKNIAGATFGTTPLSLLDRGEIAGRLVDALNAGDAGAGSIYCDAGDTGIRRGVITPSSSTYVGPWRYKPGDEALSELSATLDGFDWEIAPVEPVADAFGVQIGALNASAAIGSLKAEAVWEFGDGRSNVAEWTDVSDAGGLCNRGVNLPPSYPDNATQVPIELSDAASIAARGLHEAVIPGDLVVDDLRSKLVAEHIRIRSVPRRVISITPIPEDVPPAGEPRRVPRPFLDFIPGDVMPFRATETFKVADNSGRIVGSTKIKTVDALFRCFVLELAIANTGRVAPSLTLVQEP